VNVALTDWAKQAIRAWKTPLFGPYYHQTGYIVATTGRAPPKASEHLEKALKSIEDDPAFSSGIQRLSSASDFKDHVWQFSGPLSGFNGYYNRLAGYAHSSDAMKGLWEYLASHGVKFNLGENAGRVIDLVWNENKQCVGVKLGDGRSHPTDILICAAGAYAASLLPNVGRHATARCWSVAHVQLSEEETNYLRGIPVTNVRDLGFFFEPDPKTGLFKLCPLGTGYTNTNQDTGISLPPAGQRPWPQDFIPEEDEKKLRQLLREIFPWMAERPFVEKKMCWFSDTHDSNYCIDYVPDTQKSVICLSGDSGHGFKMMPIFGKWVVDLISAGQQNKQRWKWPTADLSGQDWGDAVSWRVGRGGELQDFVDVDSRAVRASL
jgi:sarcosine oxidase/L-pipecolate oxidase